MRPANHHLLNRTTLGLIAATFLVAGGFNRSLAYERYKDPNTGSDNCSSCHGNFTDSTSPQGTVFPLGEKHEMHRDSAYMSTDCNLCHTDGDNDNPFLKSSNGTANNAGLGCNGCHEAAGLRRHHDANGVNVCWDCHDPATPPAENVKPPYYGTVDTKANNPGNPVQVANTNENWSVGDFLGLDNDGNNLYDLADYAVGPYQVLSTIKEGNNLRVTWLTAGGRTNIVQTATNLSGSFADLSSSIRIPGVGLVTTNYLHIGGATNAARFYRMKAIVP